MVCLMVPVHSLAAEEPPGFRSSVVGGLQMIIRLSQWQYGPRCDLRRDETSNGDETVIVDIWLTNRSSTDIVVCVYPLDFALSARLGRNGKDVFDTEDRGEMRQLFEKVRKGTASPEEMELFWKNHIKQTRAILERGEEIFDIREMETNPPEKARIFDSVICDKCKESTMITKITEKDGKKLCIPCSKEG